MNIQQYIITDRVKLTLLPTTFTYEIDGKVFESDDDEPYDDREIMLESALEELMLEYSNNHSDDDSDEAYEAFELAMRKLHNQLLPNYPIDE